MCLFLLLDVKVALFIKKALKLSRALISKELSGFLEKTVRDHTKQVCFAAHEHKTCTITASYSLPTSSHVCSFRSMLEAAP